MYFGILASRGLSLPQMCEGHGSLRARCRFAALVRALLIPIRPGESNALFIRLYLCRVGVLDIEISWATVDRFVILNHLIEGYFTDKHVYPFRLG